MIGSQLTNLIIRNNLTKCKLNFHTSKDGDIFIDAIDDEGNKKLHLNANTGKYKIYGDLNEHHVHPTRY